MYRGSGSNSGGVSGCSNISLMLEQCLLLFIIVVLWPFWPSLKSLGTWAEIMPVLFDGSSPQQRWTMDFVVIICFLRAVQAYPQGQYSLVQAPSTIAD